MAVVYQHIRLDTNEVFYVGIGKTVKRAYSKDRRNSHWKNIVKNTEYIVQIVLEDITWEEACQKEIELIKQYGRKDLNEGTLVNMTDGGESGFMNFNEESLNKMRLAKLGSKQNEETIQKRSSSLKGKKRPSDVRDKLSKSKMGDKNPMYGKKPWNKNISPSEEVKEKLRNANLGKKQSDETKMKRSNSLKGRKFSEESIQKMRIAAQNRKNKNK